MLLIDQLEQVTEWLQDNVCNKIHMYEPTDKIGNEIPKTVHPTAYTMFIPSKDMLKEQKKIPALCVQLDEGSDDLPNKECNLNLVILFAVWNPGEYVTHGDEVKLIENTDGWKDVFRFIDKVQRELEKTVYIAGMRLDKQVPTRYSLYKTKEGIVDAWPYWYGEMRFTLKAGMAKVPVASYQNLL